MKDLTEKQRTILAFIQATVTANGSPPTLREIAAQFGRTATNAASDHIAALVKKGYLARDPMKSRGIRVLRGVDGSPMSSDLLTENAALREEVRALKAAMTKAGVELLDASVDRNDNMFDRQKDW